MGHAYSSESDPPNHDWVVMFKAGTAATVHESLMDELKERGNHINFVYWPDPLGFSIRVPDVRDIAMLRAHRDVHSVELDTSVEAFDSDVDMWTYLCGTVSRRSTPRRTDKRPLQIPGDMASSHADDPMSVGTAAAIPAENTGDFSTKSSAEVEVEAMVTFAAAVLPYRVDAWTAQRFVKAKQGKLDAAAEFYRAHMRWREAERMDTIRSDPVARTPPQESYLSRTFTPKLLDGLDARGRPVLYFAPRDVSSVDVAQLGLSEVDLFRSYCRVMEDVCDAIKASRNPDSGCLKIYDFRHLTVLGSIRSLSFAVRFGKLMEVNYPQTLGALHIVGVPSGAEWVISRVQSFLPPVVTRKIKIEGGEPLRVLQQLLPMDLIPTEAREAMYPTQANVS